MLLIVFVLILIQLLLSINCFCTQRTGINKKNFLRLQEELQQKVYKHKQHRTRKFR